MLYIFGVLFSVLFMIVALFAYSIQNKRESIIKKKKK